MNRNEEKEETGEEARIALKQMRKGNFFCCVPLKFTTHFFPCSDGCTLKQGVLTVCIYDIILGIIGIFLYAGGAENPALETWRWVQALGLFPAIMTLIFECKKSDSLLRAKLGRLYYGWKIMEMIMFMILLIFICTAYGEIEGSGAAWTAFIIGMVHISIKMYCAYVIWSFYLLLFQVEEELVDTGRDYLNAPPGHHPQDGGAGEDGGYEENAGSRVVIIAPNQVEPRYVGEGYRPYPPPPPPQAYPQASPPPGYVVAQGGYVHPQGGYGYGGYTTHPQGGYTTHPQGGYTTHPQGGYVHPQAQGAPIGYQIPPPQPHPMYYNQYNQGPQGPSTAPDPHIS